MSEIKLGIKRKTYNCTQCNVKLDLNYTMWICESGSTVLNVYCKECAKSFPDSRPI